MEPNKLLTVAVFTFLPLLFLLRGYYGFVKYKEYGTQKISIFAIAKRDMSTNAKLVLIARTIIGVLIVGYSVIAFAIILVRNR